MEQNQHRERIVGLGIDITGFGKDIIENVKQLEDELVISEKENEEVLDKASKLSKQIIDIQKEKLKVLQKRDQLLNGTKQELSLLLASYKRLQKEVPSSESRQTTSSQHQKTNLEMQVDLDVTQREDITCLVSSQHLKETSIIRDEKQLPSQTDDKISNENQDNGGALDADSQKQILSGLRGFNQLRKSKIQELRKVFPDDLTGFRLNQKFKVLPVTEEIVCSAGSKDILVLVTKTRLFGYFIKSRQNITVELKESASCLELQSENEAILGAECGSLTLLNFKTKDIHIVYNCKAKITGIKLHPNQVFAVVTLSNRSWALIDVPNRKLLRNQDTGSIIRGFDVHPNGVYLSTFSDEGSITFWDVRLQNQIGQKKLVEELTSVKFLIHGNWICASSDNFVRLLDAINYPKGTMSWTNPNTSPLSMMQIEASGRLICCVNDNNVSILTTTRKENGKYVNKLEALHNVAMEGTILLITFVESEIYILLESGELKTYCFSS